MADTKRVALPKYTTPKGTFKYPKLDKPDYGTKEFPMPDGVFSTQFVLPADAAETQAFIAKLQPHFDAATKAAEVGFSELSAPQRKKLGSLKMNEFFAEELDKETEEPTGNLVFKFKQKFATKIQNGKRAGSIWYRAPALFDAKGQVINGWNVDGKPTKKCPEIWSGSVGKVTFEVSPYFVKGTGAGGISLILLAAQIIERRSGQPKNAEGYGFSQEEGYSAEDDNLPEEMQEDTEAGTADDADF